MIDYLAIKNADRETIGIIDTAKSIIWHSVYYGVGDFEIYAPLSPQHLDLLKIGYYVTRPNNDEVGVIEQITVDFNPQDGYMITATGRFAKSILDRRLIYKLSDHTLTPQILSGKVEIAVRSVVQNNAISCTFDTRRNIPILGLAALNNLSPVIVSKSGDNADKQVSFKNLLEYTDGVLQEYGLSSKIIYNESNKKLLYSVFQGADRSTENTEGNEGIVFSVDFDNLNSSNYLYDDKTQKNAALIGGAGEGLERFYSLLTGGKSGLQLREMFVDASSINRKYKNEGETEEQTYTDAQYTAMLNQRGSEELAQKIITENFTGELNATFGVWQYGRDYFLGDIVTVQDNMIGKYINARITEATEVQDENGYTVHVTFGE